MHLRDLVAAVVILAGGFVLAVVVPYSVAIFQLFRERASPPLSAADPIEEHERGHLQAALAVWSQLASVAVVTFAYSASTQGSVDGIPQLLGRALSETGLWLFLAGSIDFAWSAAWGWFLLMRNFGSIPWRLCLHMANLRSRKSFSRMGSSSVMMNEGKSFKQKVREIVTIDLIIVGVLAAIWRVSEVSVFGGATVFAVTLGLVGLVSYMEPPLVLVLAKSSKRGLFIQTQLDGTGVTTASLLNWDELELRARAWSHLAKPITNPYDIHRTTEQGDWRAEVEQLIDLVPIVILDVRELSPAVLWEADALLRPERSKKALFIVNDDRKSPVLEGFREILGPEVDTMGTRATEADVFGFFERVSRGLRHPVRLEMFLTSTEQFRMELDLSQRLRGEDHPKTLALINTLAAAVAKEGNVAEGISLLRRALNLRERVHGSEHPNTVATAHNLAWLLLTKGDLAAADVLYRRVLASKERDGTEIDFAIILNNHALLLRKLSRFDEAAEQLRRAIAIEDRLLPTGHPNRAHRRNNLAIVLMLAGQTDDAAEANVEASELNARYVESEHDMTSVRILVIRVVLQWLQGSDAAVALGQIQLLLEQPELPCHGRIDANWKVEDVIEHLRAKLSTQQVRLLVSIVESLNASKASQ